MSYMLSQIRKYCAIVIPYKGKFIEMFMMKISCDTIFPQNFSYHWVFPEKICTPHGEEMESDPPSLQTASPLPRQQSPKLYPRAWTFILSGLINLSSDTATIKPPELL